MKLGGCKWMDLSLVGKVSYGFLGRGDSPKKGGLTKEIVALEDRPT